jgi:hypothetical protein
MTDRLPRWMVDSVYRSLTGGMTRQQVVAACSGLTAEQVGEALSSLHQAGRIEYRDTRWWVAVEATTVEVDMSRKERVLEWLKENGPATAAAASSALGFQCASLVSMLKSEGRLSWTFDSLGRRVYTVAEEATPAAASSEGEATPAAASSEGEATPAAASSERKTTFRSGWRVTGEEATPAAASSEGEATPAAASSEEAAAGEAAPKATVERLCTSVGAGFVGPRRDPTLEDLQAELRLWRRGELVANPREIIRAADPGEDPVSLIGAAAVRLYRAVESMEAAEDVLHLFIQHVEGAS